MLGFFIFYEAITNNASKSILNIEALFLKIILCMFDYDFIISAIVNFYFVTFDKIRNLGDRNLCHPQEQTAYL